RTDFPRPGSCHHRSRHTAEARRSGRASEPIGPPAPGASRSRRKPHPSQLLGELLRRDLRQSQSDSVQKRRTKGRELCTANQNSASRYLTCFDAPNQAPLLQNCARWNKQLLVLINSDQNASSPFHF